jgi:methylated-DNA-[protein]-cysteine S-methyltransferase
MPDKDHDPAPLLAWAFSSELGWMALLGDGRRLRRLVFGQPSRRAALSAATRGAAAPWSEHDWSPALAARLERYALRGDDGFGDVAVDLAGTTPFQRRVLQCCRRIRPGQTLSYGRLAAAAGAPGAARAVGSVMAANPCPLVIPCHRVVQAGGRIGNFSAPQGPVMKARLLALEAAESSQLASAR